MPGTDAGARMQGTSVERECGVRTQTQNASARRERGHKHRRKCQQGAGKEYGAKT